MGTRVQAAYMYALDQDEAYSHVTIPEQETLNATDSIDIFRGVAGAAHTAGNNVISSETGARSVFFQRETYTMAWYDWLWHANNQYMGGVNATVLHGTEYSYAPASVWPGPCMAMPKGGLAEPTGQRMPYAQLMDETISSYLAREQYVLQEGKADLDVAVYYYYMEIGNDYLNYFLDDCMSTAGYTYEFLGDSSLTTTAEASDGNVLADSGASYRALVIDQYRMGENEGESGTGMRSEPFKGNGYMPLKSAQAVLKMAKQGLPIVIVGEAPDKTALESDHYTDGQYVEGYGDEQIQAIFAEITAMDNCKQVESDADVADALKELEVTPDSAYDEAAALETNPDWGTVDLYTAHRSCDDVDYYMLFNRSHTVYWEDEEYGEETLGVNKDHNIATYVEFKAKEGAVPYLLDCWSGEVEKITDYTVTENGTYRIYVDLDASETMTIAIGTENWFDGEETKEARMTKADETSEISLTDGSCDWNLSLTLYKPTDEWIENPTKDCTYYNYEETGESGNATITYEEIRDINPLGENGMKFWAELEELGENPERASGIGEYTTNLNLSDDFDFENGTFALEFEEVTEVFTVKVNGEAVYFAQNASHGAEGDISEYLHSGDNEIVITVASGLYNAAKYYNTQAAAKNPEIIPQQSEETWVSRDGIIGNVSLKYYAE